MFKRRHIKEAWPLAEAIPDRIDIDRSEVSTYGHRRELQLTLALVLDRDADPRAGWPDRQGMWFAKRTFKIKLKSVVSTFDLREMTPEQASDWTGFRGALVHVDYNDGMITEEPTEETPLGTCYVAKEIYEAMQRPNDGATLQGLVMAEVVAAMLISAKDDILEAAEASKGSSLAAIMERLGGNRAMKLDELKNLVRFPNRLRAAVHDRTMLVELLRKV